MKNLLKLAVISLSLFITPLFADAAPVKVGLVNFKKIIETSKLGKHEQETFEMMKKQMESIIADKEKAFNEIATKIGDEDYRDSLNHEALEKLEKQYRGLGQELAQAQNQYYQALQQANMKILGKIAEVISQASEKVAKAKGFDLVLNDDNAFFSSTTLDITPDVVAEMDILHAEELKSLLNPKPAETKK